MYYFRYKEECKFDTPSFFLLLGFGAYFYVCYTWNVVQVVFRFFVLISSLYRAKEESVHDETCEQRWL